MADNNEDEKYLSLVDKIVKIYNLVNMNIANISDSKKNINLKYCNNLDDFVYYVQVQL